MNWVIRLSVPDSPFESVAVIDRLGPPLRPDSGVLVEEASGLDGPALGLSEAFWTDARGPNGVTMELRPAQTSSLLPVAWNDSRVTAVFDL